MTGDRHHEFVCMFLEEIAVAYPFSFRIFVTGAVGMFRTPGRRDHSCFGRRRAHYELYTNRTS
jgi:hypothetical protein